MDKRIIACSFMVIFCATAVAWAAPSEFVSRNTYENMRPFMNNEMRVKLNPGDNTGLGQSQTAAFARVMNGSSNTPVSDYVQRQENGTAPRRVVARKGTVVRSATNSGATGGSNIARSATSGGAGGGTTARAAAPSAGGNAGETRRVVARATRADYVAPDTSTRGDNSYYYQRTSGVVDAAGDKMTPNSNVSLAQCMAEYSSCMDGYCQREGTAYDRCYCSARLAQIDGQLRPEIEDLTRQLVILAGGGTDLTDAEWEDKWQNEFGQYYGQNSLAQLNEALASVDWTDFESQVRGQNAFITGHEWCANHLRNCFSASESMKGIYKSSIQRDCGNYETYLQKIKRVAEMAIEQNKK